MRATTLAALDAEGRREAFNRVYEGYIVPLRMTTEQASQHMEVNDIALEHSPVWLDDGGELLALAALGVRGRRGWVGGFGVAPPARGQGLGGRLIEAVLEIAGRLGLDRVQLEVIEGNAAAIRTYERAGFATRRQVRIVERDPVAGPLAGAAGAAREVEAGAALAWAAEIPREPPVWQREAAGLGRLADLRALAAGPAGAPRAVVIYRQADEDARLLDLAGEPAAARSLLAALVARYPAGRLRLGNEPATSPLSAPLEEGGWRESLRQHEMVWTLAAL
jgi:ribosomal protein S18 acetylase RimI-like enzyme